MSYLFLSLSLFRKHLEYESKLIETILHIPRCNQNITINDSANNSNFGNASNQTNGMRRSKAARNVKFIHLLTPCFLLTGFGNASTPPPSTSQSTTPGPDNSNTSSQTYPSTTASNGHETTNNVKTRYVWLEHENFLRVLVSQMDRE